MNEKQETCNVSSDPHTTVHRQTFFSILIFFQFFFDFFSLFYFFFLIFFDFLIFFWARSEKRKLFMFFFVFSAIH